MTVSMTFLDHMRRGAKEILDRFPDGLKPEIYVVSFNIWRVNYDPRFPFLTIGYNTESEVRRALDTECSYEGAARWEYSYWLLEGFEKLGRVPEDPVGGELYVEEMRKRGIWYDGEAGPLERPQVEVGVEDMRDSVDERLVLDFDEVCIGLARHLHDSGQLDAALGRAVPIVVFDMDRPEWEIEATEAANPPSLIAEFSAHVGGS
ncbi:hypothetical protein GCM10009837_64360 [Streptomyces durmitorensis]|uniref:Uncharacterized protein n=1 Tax=Streptomyces durmitorensis TaxID=319947 RepID=A0ABY4PUV4_9ACTN|nr:hypothetical protein [Streptomyces durmitorensis]UQT57014.1 hypothetical protein M4V62_18965 [Streptomyces durmitorensis]